MFGFGKKKVKHPDTGVAQYVQGRMVGPGTQELVYETPFTLPVIVTAGSGRIPRRSLAVLQSQQQPVVMRVPTRGVGGTMAGQIVFQPLSKNNPTGGS